MVYEVYSALIQIVADNVYNALIQITADYGQLYEVYCVLILVVAHFKILCLARIMCG